jgi:zinc and cadmium transporter
MYIFILIILATILVSTISLVMIIFLSLNERVLNRLLLVLVAFASGTMLGGAFLHLIPESYTGEFTFFGYVLFGILLFFMLEKFLKWRHCHEGECDIHAFAYLNLVGDGIHNFVDGMIIAASFLTSVDLGIITTVAVIAHEVPQEIGDFGILVYGGFSKIKAISYNFVSQTTAILGAVITYLLAQSFGSITEFLLPIAAGGFIYIAATDLFPELHKKVEGKYSIVQFIVILLGIMLMWSLRLLFK